MSQVLALFLETNKYSLCQCLSVVRVFFWLYWSWTMGDLFALEIPVDCMKIVLTSVKLY